MAINRVQQDTQVVGRNKEVEEPLNEAAEVATRKAEIMAATYMGEKAIEASVGDVVMAPGNVRAIVIAVNGVSVKILGIGTDTRTGDTSVLKPPYVHDCPASVCHYMEKQTLNR